MLFSQDAILRVPLLRNFTLSPERYRGDSSSVAVLPPSFRDPLLGWLDSLRMNVTRPSMNPRTTWGVRHTSGGMCLLLRELFLHVQLLLPLYVFCTSCSTPQPRLIRPGVNAQGQPVLWRKHGQSVFLFKSLKEKSTDSAAI